MSLTQKTARDLIGDQLFPCLKAEQDRLEVVDRWYRWDHDRPHQPRQSTVEYRQLAARAQTPWLDLVVTSVAQALYVEGYRQPNAQDEASAWAIWQTNGLDGRQIAVHRAALAYGYSWTTVLPGMTPTGDPMPAIRGVDPSEMTAFYVDPAQDDWPVYALRSEAAKVNGNPGRVLKLYDDERIWRFESGTDGSGLTFVTWDAHDIGICPVVRFANRLDLKGRTDGEVEPLIPTAGRIDQTVFDRLVVQRFSSWIVRTIAGMTQPEDAGEADATKLRLRVDDILVADDPDTKFGSLPASPLNGFIEAKDADLRDLSAVAQVPPHHLLGQIANLSAEALAAAEASLSRKVEERKHTFGESWEQVLRLASMVAGDVEGARDFTAEVRWADMESRSLAQAADALGKLAQMLGVPVELLWEKIPGFTQQDVERAKALRDQGGVEMLMQQLLAGQTSEPPAPGPAPAPPAA